jgi:transposase
MARSAAAVSQPSDVLATAAAVGRTRRLVTSLARAAGRTGRARAASLGRDVSGRHVLPGQKGGDAVGKTKRGKGTKAMVLADGQGIPLGVFLASATPSEVSLAEPTLAAVQVPRRGRGRPRMRPQRIIADRGYDSDPLRRRFRRRGIDLIVPYRSNNRKKLYEDGRKLRRCRRRWKIERTFAWLSNFRRLQVRQDRILTVFQGFCHVACLLITLRYF